MQSFGGKFKLALLNGNFCQKSALARRRLAGERMRLPEVGGGGSASKFHGLQDTHTYFTRIRHPLALKMNRESGVYFWDTSQRYPRVKSVEGVKSAVRDSGD
jgi:hypothetical protein